VVAHELVDAGAVSWLRTAEKESIEEAEELTSRVERELQQAGLETEARVVRGDPRAVLVDEAIAMDADLLVVGSHGRSGLDRLLMGSVASHVVAHAPCTVTVVRAKK
jgi:nucleotide-binding universal stress UspA family protein